MEVLKRKKSVSIVIPVYNEEAVIDELGKELRELMQRNSEYDFEVVLVENGSQDESLNKMLSLRKKDSRFKILRLSRNFMADGGVAAGLNYCKGDCAILMDADLQDPPKVVDKFLQKWEEGNEVVYGVIKSRQGIGVFRRIFNKIFYFLLNFVTTGKMPQNVTAFRLMDKVVYRELNKMREKNRFTRGLCSWTGFRQIGVEFDRAPRFAGEPKSYFFDIFNEALDAIFSFSFLPLRCITILGIIVTCISLVFIIFLLIVASIYRTIPGYRSLIIMIFMMFGFMFTSLGIVGEYIARIFDEVKNRPIYIVKDEIGFEK